MMADDPAVQAKHYEDEPSSLKHLAAQYVRPLIELNDKINELTALERGVNSTRIGADLAILCSALHLSIDRIENCRQGLERL
eukprot:scaffold184750_cov48-Prasinocladus_malaysianus.AAC.1